MSSEGEGLRPERTESEADKASAELKDQMSHLKARYRIERRLLETRSFRPKKP